MARTVTVTVGPLAATSTNNIVTSQNPGVTGYLALNGTLGTATANSIALSQTITGASAVLINGALKQTIPQTGAAGAALAGPRHIYITSAGNDSGVTFAIVGLDVNSASVTETLTGGNTKAAVSLNVYKSIISITTSGSTAAAITVGDFGSATLDTPRQVLITTASTTAFKITGTNGTGDTISETVTNAGSSVASVLSYLTVSSILATSPTAAITVGTNGVADSQWILFDEWGFNNIAVQVNVTGTANYTVFTTNDDFAGIVNPSTPSAINWSSTLSPLVSSAVTGQGVLTTPCRGAKVTLNSETAGTGNFVTASFTQYGNVPLQAMKSADAKAFIEAVHELYPALVEAVIGYRKDVTASTLSILLAEVCLLGSDEKQALVDIDKVASVAKDHAKILALRDAPTGRMN